MLNVAADKGIDCTAIPILLLLLLHFSVVSPTVLKRN
jgi:hypothetical protein